MPNFSPTENLLMQVLADGRRHKIKDLVPVIGDELTQNERVHDHVARIRKKLEPIGQGILCEYYKGAFHYRLIRFITSDS